MELEETLESVWEKDKLNRRQDAEYIIRFLKARIEERGATGEPRSYVLNLNAEWGMGKTFFLKCLEEHLRATGHVVARVDAWESDHADDPLLPAMSAIEDGLRPLMNQKPALKATFEAVRENAGRVALTVGSEIGKSLLRKYLGDVADDLPKLLKDKSGAVNDIAAASADAIGTALSAEIDTLVDSFADQQIEGFRRAQNSIAQFKKSLQTLTAQLGEKEVRLPIFVLIDELDRCRPTYALAMLERIKHLFAIDNVVFVVATDTEQLQHSIGAVYGTGFDAQRYLHRFFDRTYVLEFPELGELVPMLMATRPLNKSLLSTPPGFEVDEALLVTYQYYRSNPREILRTYDLLRTILSTWQEPVPIELTLMLPLIILNDAGGSIDPIAAAVYTARMQSDTQPRGSSSYNIVWHDLQGHRLTRGVTPDVLLSHWGDEVAKDLQKIYSASSGDAAVAWIGSRFDHEFGMLHKNSAPNGVAPLSIMKDYPGLIRRAGRLSRLEAKDNT